MANDIEFYSIAEVLKELEISSEQLNDLLKSGRLKPVRHNDRVKFKSDDVEKIREELSQTNQVKVQESHYYSWQQVLCQLQLEPEELEKMVEQGDIKVYEDREDKGYSG